MGVGLVVLILLEIEFSSMAKVKSFI